MPSREFEVYIKPMVDQSAVNKAKSKIQDSIGGEPVDIKLGTQEMQKQLKEISGAVKGIQGVMKSGFSVKGTKEVNDAFNSMIGTIEKLDTKLEDLFKDSKQAGSVVNVGDIKLAEGQLNALEQSLKDIQSTLTDISNKSKTAFQLKGAKTQAERDLKAINKTLMGTYSANFDSGFKIDLDTTDFKRQAGDILQIGKKTAKEINEMFSGRRNPNTGMSAYYNNLLQTLSGHLASGGKLSDKINAFAFTDTNGSVKAVETTVGEVVNALRNMFRQVSNEGENLEATLDRIFNIPKSMSKVNSGIFKDLFNAADAREKLGVIESEFTEAEAREARFSKSTIKNFEAISKALKEFIVDGKGIDSLIQTFEKLNTVLEELKTTLTTTDFNAVAQTVNGSSGGRGKGTNSLESISKQVAKINTEYKELASLKKEMDAKGLDSSNTKTQLSSLLSQRKALTDEYVALSAKSGIDEDKAKRNLFLATQRLQAENKLTQGVKEETAALKERNKEEEAINKSIKRNEKKKQQQEERAEAKRIKELKKEILDLDKQIFEVEKNSKNAVGNASYYQKERSRLNAERSARFNELGSKLNTADYNEFLRQRNAAKVNQKTGLTNKEQNEINKGQAKLAKNLGEVQEKLNKIKANPAFNLVKQDVENADNSIKELANDLGKIDSKDSLNEANKKFSTLKTSVESVSESLKEAKKYNDQFADITKKMTELQSKGGYTPAFASTFDDRLNEINNLQKNATSVQELGEAYAEASTKLVKFEAETKDLNNLLANQTSIDKLNLKIEKFVQDNSKMGHKFSEQFGNLQVKLKGADITQQQIKDITSEFLRLEAQVYKFGKTGNSMFDNLRNRIKQMSTNFIAMYFSFYDIIRYVRQTVSAVTEIDSALTELRKVSDASQLRVAQNFEVSAKAAQDLGSTIKDVINITADWSRLNISGLIYSNV